MRRSRLTEEKGFSLIELVIVIIVVAILATAASIGLNSLSTVRLNNAVGKVVADLRYAQQLSATTRSRHGMTALSIQSYRVHEDCGLDGICGNADDAAQTAGTDTPVKDPNNLGSNFDVDFNAYQQGQLSGVAFNSATPFCPAGCGACQAQIEFSSLGAPADTSGNVYSCNVTVVLTRAGATNQTITIEANTGQVR